MHLWEEGCGIERTHVTIEDIEKAFQNQFAAGAKFGDGYKISDIGEGNGYLSKTLLVTPNWVGNDAALPKQFVVKICSLLPVAQIDPRSIGNFPLEQRFREIHNLECNFYSIAMKYNKPKLRIPKMFTHQLFTDQQTSKGFIALEYIENFQPMQVYSSFFKDFRQVFPSIIELVKIGMELSENERQHFDRHFFANVLGCKREFLPKFISDVQNVLGQRHEELFEKFAEISNEIFSEEWLARFDGLPEKLGMPKVLVHGDLFLPNTLWTKNGDGLDLKAIVDFQWIHMGFVAFDLATVLCSCLNGKNRKGVDEITMRDFYYLLVNDLKFEPFSFEQFMKSYNYGFLMAAILVSFSMSTVYLEHLEKGKQNMPPEEEVREKLQFLMEDAVHMFERIQRIEGS